VRIPILVVGLALVCAGPVAAQGVSVGVRGGLNLADVSFDGDDPSPSLGSRTGLVAGAFVTVPLFRGFALQPEVLYSSKGAKLDDEGIQSTLMLDYVEVPVLGRMSGNAFRGGRFYVVAGPSVGVRVRAKSKTVFSGSTEEFDISGEIERLDIGVTAGAGLQFGALVIDGRFTYGLSDIDSDKTDAVEVTNRVLSLSAGLRF
jgi:hypothetical protein